MSKLDGTFCNTEAMRSSPAPVSTDGLGRFLRDPSGCSCGVLVNGRDHVLDVIPARGREIDAPRSSKALRQACHVTLLETFRQSGRAYPQLPPNLEEEAALAVRPERGRQTRSLGGLMTHRQPPRDAGGSPRGPPPHGSSTPRPSGSRKFDSRRCARIWVTGRGPRPSATSGTPPSDFAATRAAVAARLGAALRNISMPAPCSDLQPSALRSRALLGDRQPLGFFLSRHPSRGALSPALSKRAGQGGLS